jgi:hypothetical protein
VDRLTRALKPLLVAAAGVVTALGVASLTQAAPGGGYAAGTTPTTTVTCAATLIATMTPIDNAENFGKTKCSAPFGKGVQYDYSKITRTSKTAGSFAGSFKLFFNTGTLRGKFDMTFTAGSGTATYEGTMKVSSGTGEFTGVKGEGPINGTSDDLVHTTVTEKLTLTIPPAKKK